MLASAFLLCLAPSVGLAQTQTAEGAQKFLSSIMQSAKAKAYVVGDVDVISSCQREGSYSDLPCTPEERSHTGTRKKRYTWTAQTIEMGESGCMTRAISYPLRAPEDFLLGDQKLRVRFVSEPVILRTDVDWSRATVKRGAYGGVVSFSSQSTWNPGQTNGVTVEAAGGKALVYISDDPEILDRIEYAMKFLVLSCDMTANTGF